MMGARSGTARHRAASALRGARLGSGSCAEPGTSSPAAAPSSFPPKSAKVSNLGLAGPAAASSRALSCGTECTPAERTANEESAHCFTQHRGSYLAKAQASIAGVSMSVCVRLQST